MRENPRARQLIAGAAGLAVAVTGLVALAPTAGANTAGSELVISEIYGGGGNNGAVFKNDFIELYNPTASPITLTDYSVTAHQSNGTAYGAAQPLSGTLAPGKHYLIKEGAGTGTTMPDLPAADLEPAAPFGMAGTNVSVQLLKNGLVVDTIGTGSAALKEGTATAAMTNSTSASRNATGVDTDNNVADFTLGSPTPTASGAGPVDPPDPVDETLTIAEIQGTDATSPKVGVNATTTGVVTGKYPTGGMNGFFLQTGGPDTTPDASDGLFVYAPGNDQSSFGLGDTLTVTGVVSEFGNATQITATTIAQAATAQPAVVAKTTIPGTDCALPGDACLDAAALAVAREKVESEFFKPTGDFTVTDAYDGSSYTGGSPSSANYGDIGLAAESATPLYNLTEVIDPADAAAVATRKKYNDAHRIILDDGSSWNFAVSNTATPNERTSEPMPYQSADHQVRVGAKATFPEGAVLNFRNGIFALQPTTRVIGAPTASQPQFTQTRKATPETIGGDLKLATFNVLNYFTTLGVDVAGCTFYKDREGVPNATNSCPGNGPRGAWDQAGFERQQTKIVKAINALGADVVSLEELENSLKVDGANRDEAITALVAALNADAGATRWAFAPSPATLPAVADEDVIRTGFIYNPATVERVGESQILIGSAAFANAREPLAQAFKPKGGAADQVFAVIVNHFKSKGATGATGDNLDTGQGGYNGDRTRQAQALVSFANDFAAARNTTKVFLTGDFNAYSKEDPVKALEAAGFANLESTTNPGERSYTFDGGIGSLDHVFVSADAEAWVKGVDIWETNANESVYRQYSRYNANITDLYQPNVFAASDHNPEIVGFTPDTTAGTTTDIQILGTNDFHGRLLNNVNPATDTFEAGAAQFAGAVAQLRAENPNTVFAAGGDLIGGSTFESFIQKDKPTLDALNAAGLDVSAAGNHEFDAGYADLVDRVMKPYDATTNPEGGAKWQYLAANVRKKSDNSYALPDVAASPGVSDGGTWMKEIDGVKVGFVGAVTEDLPSLVTPGGIADVKVSSIIDETNAAADRLTADGADLVVMLVHEGATDTTKASAEDTSTAFGKIVAGVDSDVDAIISGHTHKAYNHSINGRPVVSSGQYGTNLNKLVFSYDSATDQVTLKSQDIVKAVDVQVTAPAATAVKTEVTGIVDAAKSKADVLGADELGKLGGPFNRARTTSGENRGGESTLGNTVAEVQRWATRNPESGSAQIAFMNPGGLRQDMTGTPGGYPAVLTYKQAAVVQPFANTLVNMKLTGAQVKKVLEQQWQRDKAGNVPSRPFLRLGVSKGFTYTYDPTRPEGDRITGMWLDGAAIDLATQYSVTVNSFLSTGGDNFHELANGTATNDTGKSDLNAMVDYMAQYTTTALAVDWSQQAVGVSKPAGQPSSYRPGESGTIALSSLAFTGTGDVQDTTVSAKAADGTVLGKATDDNAPGTVPNDEYGKATLTFAIPAGTPAGPFAFEVVGDKTGTKVPVTVNVEKAVTSDATVTVTASPTSVAAQTGVSTLSVEVKSTGSTPTGLVTAQVGNQLVGGGELTAGKATFDVGPFSTVGTQTVVVKYLGDGATKPAQGAVDLTVTKAPVPVKATPVVKATITPASVVVKTGLARGTVTVTSPDGAVTGTVVAKVAGKVAGIGEVVNGKATVDLLPFAKVGTTQVSFSYLGDDATKPGSSTASVKVIKATAKITIKAPKKAKVKKKVTIKVTVAATGQNPSGKVTVKVGKKQYRAVVRGGMATVTAKVKKKGTVKVTATYTGDAFVNAGSAKPVRIKVRR